MSKASRSKPSTPRSNVHLSVVIPVKDPDVHALEKTLISVLSQKEIQVQLVVVGAWEHKAASSLLQSTPNVRWVNERDSGIYDAMNKGLSLCDGEYILFLGAGDYLVNATVGMQLFRIAHCFGFPHLIYGRVWDEDLGLVGGKFNRWRLCRRNIPHQAIFYSRAVFEILGTYNQRYPILADYEFNMRCFAAGVKRVFVDMLVAVCAGGGISKRARDAVFESEKERLIWGYFGPLYGLSYALGKRAKRCLRRLLGGAADSGYAD
jgi:glycosyltransferase involved in cell wall biosynthesis